MTTLAVSRVAIAYGSSVAFRPVRFMVQPASVTVGFNVVGLAGSYAVNPSLVSVRLDRLNTQLPIATGQGLPTTQWQMFYQRNADATEAAIKALSTNQVNLAALVKGLLETQRGVAEAQAVAKAASGKANTQAAVQAVRDSYSDSNVLTASNASGVATITIAAHTRHYIDGQADVSVNGGTIAALAGGTEYFVFYIDQAFAGGAVTFQAATTEADAVASTTSPYRHKVGSILTPNTTGGGSIGETSPPSWRDGNVQ